MKEKIKEIIGTGSIFVTLGSLFATFGFGAAAICEPSFGGVAAFFMVVFIFSLMVASDLNEPDCGPF